MVRKIYINLWIWFNRGEIRAKIYRMVKYNLDEDAIMRSLAHYSGDSFAIYDTMMRYEEFIYKCMDLCKSIEPMEIEW